MKPLRRKSRVSSIDDAWLLLERAPEVTLCTTDEDGAPLVRVLNGALLDDTLVFHGALKGEKTTALGRRAVVSAYRSTVDVPSTFSGTEKACPATTYYESVQASGTLEAWTRPEDKARALEALMQKLQPEGGYRSLVQHLDFYEKDLRGVLVFGLRLETVVGKANIGKDRPTETVHAVVRGLFERGKRDDCSALEEILTRSGHPRPPWLTYSSGDQTWELFVSPTEQDIRDHAELLHGTYWHATTTAERRSAAIRRSAAWVGAKDARGRLVGAARAIGDGYWNARILDVILDPELRGRGLGQAMVRLLLDHPFVRKCTYQMLGTQDAQTFYEKFGFLRADDVTLDFPSTPMLRVLNSDQ